MGQPASAPPCPAQPATAPPPPTLVQLVGAGGRDPHNIAVHADGLRIEVRKVGAGLHVGPLAAVQVEVAAAVHVLQHARWVGGAGGVGWACRGCGPCSCSCAHACMQLALRAVRAHAAAPQACACMRARAPHHGRERHDDGGVGARRRPDVAVNVKVALHDIETATIGLSECRAAATCMPPPPAGPAPRTGVTVPLATPPDSGVSDGWSAPGTSAAAAGAGASRSRSSESGMRRRSRRRSSRADSGGGEGRCTGPVAVAATAAMSCWGWCSGALGACRSWGGAGSRGVGALGSAGGQWGGMGASAARPTSAERPGSPEQHRRHCPTPTETPMRPTSLGAGLPGCHRAWKTVNNRMQTPRSSAAA